MRPDDRAQSRVPSGVLSYVVAPDVVRTRMSEQAAAGRGGEEALTRDARDGRVGPLLRRRGARRLPRHGARTTPAGATLDLNGASYIR